MQSASISINPPTRPTVNTPAPTRKPFGLTLLAAGETTARTALSKRRDLSRGCVQVLLAIAAGCELAGRSLRRSEVALVGALHRATVSHYTKRGGILITRGYATAARDRVELTSDGRAIAAEYERERAAHLQRVREMLAGPGGVAALQVPDWL